MTADGIRLSAAQRFDWLRLSRCENVGPRTFRDLINRFGSASAALEVLPELAARRGKPLRLSNPEDIEREFVTAERLGTHVVALGEADYPALLRKIDTAPPILMVRGDLSIFRRPAVAIVGARNASAAGLVFTDRLVRGIAQAGYVIVSGLARGIDARAHQASLEAGTIAVLPGGHDRVYPPEHAALLEKILDRGAVVSEMPFGWEARGRDFPRRNRIVSALAMGVVVVEAARRSGSLITAKFAAEQGREVFAVPGSPLDPRSEGSNDLLCEGASICTAPEHVVNALGRQIADGPQQGELLREPERSDESEVPLWDEMDLADVETVSRAPDSEVMRAPFLSPDVLDAESPMPEDADTPIADRIVRLLGPTPVSIDVLARAAYSTVSDVRNVLIELEMEGRLERHGGSLFSRSEV